MGRTWIGTEARADARMVCYVHPAHLAHHTLGPFGLPCTQPTRPAMQPAHLACHAPGPFGPPHYRPIRPATCPGYSARRASSLFGPPRIRPILPAVPPAHLARHPPGTFSPLSTLKGQWAQPSLHNWTALPKWKCGSRAGSHVPIHLCSMHKWQILKFFYPPPHVGIWYQTNDMTA